MTVPLSEAQQMASVGAYVQLFELDAMALGANSIERFVLASDSSSVVTWQGHEYKPVTIEAEGFEWNGQGTLPTPKIRILNIKGALTGLVREFGDLVGATLTRTRTLKQYLDGEDEANPSEHFPLDIYRVERKSAMNKIYIEWELSSVLDQQGAMLPARQVLRDYCTHRYRYWNGTAFDYSKATCLYTGEACFNALGAPVDPSLDRCGKRVSDCKLRFGANGLLPTRAFPAVSRTGM